MRSGARRVYAGLDGNLFGAMVKRTIEYGGVAEVLATGELARHAPAPLIWIERCVQGREPAILHLFLTNRGDYQKISRPCGGDVGDALGFGAVHLAFVI